MGKPMENPMNEDTSVLYALWLTCIPGIGITLRNRLLDAFGTAQNIYAAGRDELLSIRGLGSRQCEAILAAAADPEYLAYAKWLAEDCSSKQTAILTRDSCEGRPLFDRLNALGEQAPSLLYARGTIKKLPCTIGIVGARRCTQEDKIRTARIAEEYTDKGCAIISGMAKGVDAYAQTACLDGGGYTVAVLGCGPDICYPREHAVLMECIAESGLLLSEYPPGTKPAVYRFPERNRIIAGLSDRVLIIAAGRKSGAEITAEWSRKLGRETEFIG